MSSIPPAVVTAAQTLLDETLHLMTFVNADVIAQGLSGIVPESTPWMGVIEGRRWLRKRHQ